MSRKPTNAALAPPTVRHRMLVDFGCVYRLQKKRRRGRARYIPKEVLLVSNRCEYTFVRLVAIGEDWFQTIRRHYGDRVAIYDDRMSRYRRVKAIFDADKWPAHTRKRGKYGRRRVVSLALRRVWEADAERTRAYERFDVAHETYTSVRDGGHAPRWLRDSLRRRWIESVAAEQRAMATLNDYLDKREDLFIPLTQGTA